MLLFSAPSFKPSKLTNQLGRTVPLVILRVFYIHRLTSSLAEADADTSRLLFDPSLLTALHSNISIFAACIPFARPIIDSMAVGAISNDIANPLGWVAGSYPHSGSGLPKSGSKEDGRIRGFGIKSRGDHTYNGWMGKGHGVISSIVGGNGGGSKKEQDDLELEDGTNREGSTERMVIRQTRDIDIISTPGQAL